MTTSKSPFYIVQDFISPLMCEDMIDLCDFTVPDQDKDLKYVKTEKTCEAAEQIIYERFLAISPAVQKYYGIEYKGMERSHFEWFTEGTKGELRSENSKYMHGKWLRVFPADITGILFLSDYQDKVPFEDDYEVYGGKLEFPQHKFGFNPQRGTLILFPSDPHFINWTAPIQVGDLYQARFNIVAKQPLLYDIKQFPGNYNTWFKDLL